MFALIGKKSCDLLLKKLKSTGTEYRKSNLVLLLQGTDTALLLKANTEHRYRTTFEVFLPTLPLLHSICFRGIFLQNISPTARRAI